ncbi:MAG TPA: enoyl-CoA hydratase/isomerase family protein [Spirochaetota bacterium]|nr:enoyl-CoA hydratase/isomerase family protein [Spirochaetota bacterium]
MSDPLVLCENRGPVSWITFNRPDVYNAFNLELGREAFSALGRAIEDPTTRVIVFAGSGKAFSVGADVLEVSGSDDPARVIGELATIAHRAIAELRQCPKPVVASLNRLAAGYGLALALASDIRVATERVRLRYAYSSIGLTGDGGINWSLPRMTGTSRALEIALLGEDIREEEAARLGIITKFFPADLLNDETQKIAERIAALPPKTASAIKRMIYGSAGMDLLVHLSAEHAALLEATAAPEFKTMLESLLEGFTQKG